MSGSDLADIRGEEMLSPAEGQSTSHEFVVSVQALVSIHVKAGGNYQAQPRTQQGMDTDLTSQACAVDRAQG